MRSSAAYMSFGFSFAILLSGCDQLLGTSGSSDKTDDLAQVERQLDSLPVPAQKAAGPAPDNWYPNDISPPPGTRYPCALTALPRDLTGIPPADRNYINHVYTMILRLTQAKLVLLQSLSQKSDISRVAAAYQDSNRKVYETIGAEEVPEGLGEFQKAVLHAIDLHLQWAHESAYSLLHGGKFSEIMGFPSGKSASSELQLAWREMQRRYPAMDELMKESIEHHLCALDLF